MADTYGKQITVPGLYVQGDISSSQYMAVRLASTADVVLAMDATTTVAVGVLQDAPDAANEAATVAALGVTTMVAGTSLISAGDQISYDSTGRATTANALKIGQALEAAGATGDEIRVVLHGVGAQ